MAFGFTFGHHGTCGQWIGLSGHSQWIKFDYTCIRQLTQEAEKIQKGELDHTQYVRGEDEVGQFGQAFEEMRIHFKDKMDEMGILLKVSQGIASNLDIDGAVQPILEAAMTNGGSHGQDRPCCRHRPVIL